MSELRELLDREARRIQGGDDTFDSVLHRVQHRRRTRRVTTGTVALMIAAVGAFGAYRAFRPGPADIELGQAGASQVFEGIWPETGFDELAEAQRAIDEGHQPWRTDPVETGRAFATDVMQWPYDQVEAKTLVADDPSAILVQLVNRDRPSDTGLDDKSLATFVTLEQLGRKGEQGIWSVIAVDGFIQVSWPEEGAVLVPGDPFEIGGTVSYFPAGATVEAGLFAGEGGVPFVAEGSLAARRIEGTENGFFGELGRVPEDPDGSVILVALARDGTGSIIGAAARRVMIATPETSPEHELPPSVAAKRQAILDAAATRNYEALRSLADPDNFTFSYGGGRDPVKFWDGLEREGQDPLGILDSLLDLPFARTKEGLYVWPALFGKNPKDWTDTDLDPVRQIYPEEDIQIWQDLGLYLGYRVGIEADGDWVFFVAGD